MGLLTFALDNQATPQVTVSGSLDHLFHLFGILSTTPDMLFATVIDATGNNLRGWAKLRKAE